MPKRHIIIPIFIPHLGCPNECVFCNQWIISGTQKVPAKDDIKQTVQKYISSVSGNIKHIELSFFGGSFTGVDISLQTKLLAAAKECLDEKLINGIRLSTRPDYIDSERLELLKSFDVETIELGAQSFCDSVLKASLRGHTTNDTIKASKAIKAAGFKLVIQLMTGLPKDTTESSMFSAQKAAELNADAVRIYPAVVLKHTRLAEMYLNGSYRPLSLEEAVERVKPLYLFFKENNIPVIRMGLHPLTDEEKNSVIAGAYHPAFGFLVKSSVRRDELEALIRAKLNGGKSIPDQIKSIVFSIPSRNSGEYIGNQKENIVFLKKTFAFNRIEYRLEETETPSVSFE